MKIRNGFVSNSSSSSFIILLPDNFNIETIDFEAEVKKVKYSDVDAETAKEAMERFLEQKYLWDQEGYDESYVVKEILKSYVIATLEGGPDEGQVILADTSKVKKILGL